MVQNKEFDAAVLAASNFKKLMMKRGYTQQRFSDEFGVDVRTIRNWYKKLDSLSTIQKIAEFFKVNIEDVIFGDD